jgi:hypothetical protein
MSTRREETSLDRVFISHASSDQSFVEGEIVRLLESYAVDTWYCKDDIPTGEEWSKRIAEGLAESDQFLVVLSPRAEESEWVKREVEWAVENRRGQIIPVLIEPCRPERIHKVLSEIQYVDFRVPSARAREVLLKAFGFETELSSRDSSPPGLFSLYRPGRRSAEEILRSAAKTVTWKGRDPEVEEAERFMNELCRAFLIENPDALQMFVRSTLWQKQPEQIRRKCENDESRLRNMAVRLAGDELIPLIIRGVCNTSDKQTVAPMIEAALCWHCHLCAQGDWLIANAIADVLWRILDRWGEKTKAEQLLYGRYDDV